MSAKRIAKTTIDWAKLQKLLPAEQQFIYSNLLAKNYQYTMKIGSLPENLPKIDFEYYKKQLSNPKAIDGIEKEYSAFQAAFPKDNENAISKLESSEKEDENKIDLFLKSILKSVESLKTEKVKLNNIPPLEEMTKELEVYYFPEKKLTYADVLEEKDRFALLIEKKKNGAHSHH